MYGHVGHLDQQTAIILATFCCPDLKRLHMKSEQNWLRGFRGGCLKVLMDGQMKGQPDHLTDAHLLGTQC